MKKKIIQLYFMCGISTDQLTPFYCDINFVDVVDDNGWRIDESKHTMAFNSASSFGKQKTNYGRRKRNKSND